MERDTGRCRACGAAIYWVRTSNGKSMPCNPEELPVVPSNTGDIWAVSFDGEVFRGWICSESYEDERWVYARVSHFATCPEADQFRRSS